MKFYCLQIIKVTVMLALMLGRAKAQNTFGGAGYGLLGGGHASTENLEKAVLYSKAISGAGVAVGGGGFGYIHRFTIGGAGYAFAGTEFTANSTDYRLTHGFGGLEVGYDLLGRYSNKLLFTGMFGGRSSIINVLSGADKDKTMTNESPMLGVALHWLRVIAGNGKGSGFMLGIKGAFWTGFESSRWEGTLSTPMPSSAYKPVGFFIGITIGGGGFGAKE